jgi:hypothetical protein
LNTNAAADGLSARPPGCASCVIRSNMLLTSEQAGALGSASRAAVPSSSSAACWAAPAGAVLSRCSSTRGPSQGGSCRRSTPSPGQAASPARMERSSTAADVPPSETTMRTPRPAAAVAASSCCGTCSVSSWGLSGLAARPARRAAGWHQRPLAASAGAAVACSADGSISLHARSCMLAGRCRCKASRNSSSVNG